MALNPLPIQPPAFISYLRVGRLLYLSLILFILESWVYWRFLDTAIQQSSLVTIVFWAWCFMFSFIHIYLVMMDGWSRYQNYKRAKDQLYEYGFKPRIAETYMGSKCQRMAAEVAAEELGMEEQLKSYYRSRGIKWYHYVPYFMLKEPLFLFKKSFWSRTFLEKNYQAKYNFKNLQLESTI
ncbi:hypothetical protein HX109_12295 [Galbibacter sp. BG1]|uniref:hypothetical protein n=1 Tax=Galbibacter sp. BG1 TaxID=1170699 RepID=UPI0015BA0BF9|nr:hypothetical protein [Galbibacter sp. BG1]QLE02299.1 hypothetical protein HX109_12295 [Galbibacter sp. BG1]